MNPATLTGLAFMALGVALFLVALFAHVDRTGLRGFAREGFLPFFALGLVLAMLGSGALKL